MPAYKTGKRTQQYSLGFKKKAVLWSHEPHRITVRRIGSVDLGNNAQVGWQLANKRQRSW
ncbi:hypothetical protein EDC28_104330 [Gallaecimonas pentaromativorans]|uniref:Uncharacterized protein n=1 Tax=Gallaecimonas pentaromativorans TaxID=584787 RepID=A0A3N1P8I8_9GAMM|nr:hypothetical protein EDC28_104330 [Gallaecimonas pentaromativorans]